jgi:hypothetical protein
MCARQGSRHDHPPILNSLRPAKEIQGFEFGFRCAGFGFCCIRLGFRSEQIGYRSGEFGFLALDLEIRACIIHEIKASTAWLCTTRPRSRWGRSTGRERERRVGGKLGVLEARAPRLQIVGRIRTQMFVLSRPNGCCVTRITDKNDVVLQAVHAIRCRLSVSLTVLDRLRGNSGLALHFSSRRKREGKSCYVELLLTRSAPSWRLAARHSLQSATRSTSHSIWSPRPHRAGRPRASSRSPTTLDLRRRLDSSRTCTS